MARRTLLVGLIVASTAAFVVGVSLERNAEDTHPAAATGEAGGDESAAQIAAERSGEEGDETVVGIDLESAPFVVLAVLGSLVLAAAFWFRPQVVLVLVGTAAVMAAFTLFDVAEVTHQLDENREGLALLAGGVAVLHLGAAGVAAWAGRQSRRVPA